MIWPSSARLWSDLIYLHFYVGSDWLLFLVSVWNSLTTCHVIIDYCNVLSFYVCSYSSSALLVFIWSYCVYQSSVSSTLMSIIFQLAARSCFTACSMCYDERWCLKGAWLRCWRRLSYLGHSHVHRERPSSFSFSLWSIFECCLICSDV